MSQWMDQRNTTVAFGAQKIIRCLCFAAVAGSCLRAASGASDSTAKSGEANQVRRHVTFPARPNRHPRSIGGTEDYALPSPIPAQVNNQSDVIGRRDWTNRRVVGIGPRFPGLDSGRSGCRFQRWRRASNSDRRSQRCFAVRSAPERRARHTHQLTRRCGTLGESPHSC